MSSLGRFEALLQSGQFVVTAELGPPDSSDPALVYEKAQSFDGYVDAINATDGSGANCHLSSIATCALLAQRGYTPILQISARDRNRIAIQGDVLGAAALAIENILCLTGDGVQVGDHPQAKPVFDVDSISMLDIIRTMRDGARFYSGRRILDPPNVFLGAASNPFSPPYAYRPYRLRKKVDAGAQFIQTQYCFDLERLSDFVDRIREDGTHERAYLIVGVGPLASAKTAEWMRGNVPGVHIPDRIIDRIRRSKNQQQEGINVCVEIISRLQEIKEVSGIHIMAHKQEHHIPDIVERSGLLKLRRTRARA